MALIQVTSASRETRLRGIRIANAVVTPFGRLWGGKEIVAQLITGFVASYLTLLQVPHLVQWLPYSGVRWTVLLASSLSLATLSALPAIGERRSVQQLRRQLRSCYQQYITQILDSRLDSMLESLSTRFDLGKMSASIMVPTGAAVFASARHLQIVAASNALRSLPSMALTLDWDEGVAGRVWKEGAKAAALPVKNDPAWFEEHGINPISKSKRRDGSFGHQAGICFPINYFGPSPGHVEFMGVLSIGSARASDFDIFESTEFKHTIYQTIKSEVAEHVRALLLAESSHPKVSA